MATTTIAAKGYGDKISLSAGGDRTENALGDGTSKAGNLVGRNGSGKATNVNADTVDLFEGILAKHYKTAIDTAIADGTPCKIIVPESGKHYLVRLADQGGSLSKGWPLTFGTAGNLTTAGATGLAATAPIVAYLAEDIIDDDTVALVRWA